MLIRGLRASAQTLRRSNRSTEASRGAAARQAAPGRRVGFQPEPLEGRVLMSMTLQYYPSDAKGGLGQPVTFQYDRAAGGMDVVDAEVDVRSLFDTGFTAASAIDVFIDIEGVPGESPDSKHQGQIEVESFDWQGDAETDDDTGEQEAEPRYSGLRFVSRLSKASPVLMERLATGDLVPDARVSVRRSGLAVADDFYRVDLDGVRVTSYRVTTAADGTPAEEFTLGFGAAAVEYRPQDAKGALGPVVTATWTVNETEVGAPPLPEPPLSGRSLLDGGYADPARETRMHLRLDAIEGESTTKGHEKEIEIESFSWGAIRSDADGGGPSRGTTTFSELRFVSRLDKASPLLMQRLATGKLIPNGDFVITRVEALRPPVDFYRLDFGDAAVSSYHVSSARDGSMKAEFTLAFSSTSLQYFPTDAGGALGNPVTFQHNLAADGGDVWDSGAAVSSLFDAGYAAASAVDLFLRLDGIPGESTDGKHPAHVELESFSWTGDVDTTGLAQGGPLAARPRYSELRFVSKVSKASPLLMDRLANGTNLPTATLAARAPVLTATDFYKVDLADARVSSYRVTTARDGTPAEEFTLAFGAAAVEYRPQDAKGALGPPVAAAWATGETAGDTLPGPAPRQPSMLHEGYAPPAANTAMYLRLDGVEGEAIGKGHEKQIEVESFSWGASAPAGPTGPGAAQPTFSELRFVSRTNKASPLLMENLATGRAVPNGDFVISRTSPTTGVAVDFYRLDFDDAVVSSYHLSTGHDGSMTEEFTLSFAATSLQYYPTDGKGGVGIPVTFAYNLAAFGAEVHDAGFTPRSAFDTGYAAASEVDLFLRLDGVSGESVDTKHPGQIKLESFSWAGDATPGPAGAPGGPSSPPRFSELRFVSKANKASPLLMDRLVRGTRIPNADVSARRAGSLNPDFYSVDLSDAYVSAYQVGTALDGTFTEEFTLRFSTATVAYRPQDLKGALGVPVTAQWTTGEVSGVPLPGPAPHSPPLLHEGYAPPAAGTAMYLYLDGVEGETTTKGHEKEIEVESFSWGASAPPSPDPRGEPEPQSTELRFVARLDKASPLLMRRLADGKPIANGKFSAARVSALAGPVDFYRLDFGSAVVSSYHVSTALDGSMKAEFTLQFDTPQGPPPPTPQVSIADAAVTEGTGAGATAAAFTVSLSHAAAGPVTVAWATANGTAGGADFTAASGTLTFLAGETTKTVTVAVARDALDEPDETFVVNLSLPTGATLGDAQAVGTIADDDSPPPTVTQVFVASRSWRTPFLQALAAGGLGDARFGYAVPGGAAQLRVLPWQNIDLVSVRFDRAVAVGDANLLVRGTNAGEYGHAGFDYDAETFTATWRLKQIVRNDKLLLDLAMVRGEGGALLDGEWQNPGLTAPGDTYPSGDGRPGGAFQFRVNVLAGDADGDGVVDGGDVLGLRSRTRRPRAGDRSPFYDVTGDGALNVLDHAAMLRNLTRSLPRAEPVPAAPAPLATLAGVRSERERPGARGLFGTVPVLP